MTRAFKQDKAREYGTGRHVALVGNGPSASGQGGRIDACDVVIRFNKANGWGDDTGTRMDGLVLVNHGGQMAEWLEDGTLTTMEQVRAACEITLPVPLLEGHITGTDAHGTGCDVDRVNFIAEARDVLAATGKDVVCHSAQDYAAAVTRLRVRTTSSDPIYPSSGFLTLSRLLDVEPDETRIVLFGFGFTGWSGHPWVLERAEVADLEAAGRVVVV